MPTVAIVEGMKIQFYFDDHPPPHFHAILAERRVKIAIETLQVRTGSLPKTKLDQVTDWARSRRQALRRHGLLVRRVGILGRSNE